MLSFLVHARGMNLLSKRCCQGGAPDLGGSTWCNSSKMSKNTSRRTLNRLGRMTTTSIRHDQSQELDPSRSPGLLSARQCPGSNGLEAEEFNMNVDILTLLCRLRKQEGLKERVTVPAQSAPQRGSEFRNASTSAHLRLQRIQSRSTWPVAATASPSSNANSNNINVALLALLLRRPVASNTRSATSLARIFSEDLLVSSCRGC